MAFAFTGFSYNRQNIIRQLRRFIYVVLLSAVRTVKRVRNIDPSPFQLPGGHPALDFVNTLDWRFRPSGSEELINSYDDLLRFTEQCGLLNSREVRQLRAMAGLRVSRNVLVSGKRFREALAAVLYDVVDNRPPSDNSLQSLSSFINEAQDARALNWRNGRLAWAWILDHGRTLELPLWKLSIEASTLLASEQSSQIRTCSNVECRWLFLDTSKSHSRKWCDMKLCGNRMKARRFRQKQ
jgi:predicted RNA-binding Zn ribbon-like protein